MSKELKRSDSIPATNPIKVLQFGEGNFLRAFADYCIETMNKEIGFEAGVAVVQPIENGLVRLLQDQDGLYHHVIQGLSNGKEVNDINLISCIQQAINPFEDSSEYFSQATNTDLRVVISNTTEAGIRFEAEDLPADRGLATTFPGKLTQLLYERFQYFGGSDDSGLVFIPCELIDRNGENLKSAILQYIAHWNLGESFSKWISDANYFANTLVDRIVPGYPKDKINEITAKIGYKDKLVVSSETFLLWVIEGSDEIRQAFPADEAGLNVKFVDDLTPFRVRKVRILNGAHTCMVPVGLLSGIETVRESVEHDELGRFIIDAINDEISPCIDLPEEELTQFANDVIERFKNPFIKHELNDIALNSVSKYKVRVLPSVIDYLATKGTLPKRLIYSLACLIKLYCSSKYEIRDDQTVVDFFDSERTMADTNENLAGRVLSNTNFWDSDLTSIDGFFDLIVNNLNSIDEDGISFHSLT